MPASPVLLALLLCSAGPAADGPAAGEAVNPAAAVLAEWEAATADRVPVSLADLAARRLRTPEVTEEHLELVASLGGPIDAADLLARYDWTLHAAPRPRGRADRSLRAVPRDPLARAFTPNLLVRLSPIGLPQTVYSSTVGNDDRAWPMTGPGVALAVKNSAVTNGPRRTPHAGFVIRAQNVERRHADSNPQTARRPPVRTALFSQPTGPGSTWTLKRRMKKVTAPRLINNRVPDHRVPLAAPRPE